MTDILERLRMYQRRGNLMEEAADEIERLRAALERIAHQKKTNELREGDHD